MIYCIGPASSKAILSRKLLSQGPTISVQVLNEFVNVTRNKLKLSWLLVEDALASAYEFCEVVPLTLECHKLAVEISNNHVLKIYDANVIAAAELTGCDVLYTEDLNDGQRIGRVTIVNPFKAV